MNHQQIAKAQDSSEQVLIAEGPLIAERICGTDLPPLAQEQVLSLLRAWQSHEQQDSSEDKRAWVSFSSSATSIPPYISPYMK
jgi:hypothetical protein